MSKKGKRFCSECPNCIDHKYINALVCSSACQQRKWRREHPEASRHHRKKYIVSHSEQVLAANIAWRAANPDRIKAAAKRCRDKYRDRNNAERRVKDKSERNILRSIRLGLYRQSIVRGTMFPSSPNQKD